MNRLSPGWLALLVAMITPGCSVRLPSPIIHAVSPNASPTSGGTSVTITGANFRAGATVLFGGVGALSVTVGSATQIQAVTPPHAAGRVDVTVRNADGQSGTLGSSSGFIYTTPPAGPARITSISPNSATPGTQVTINGANLGGGATVAFGGTRASSTIFVSSSQLKAPVPTIGTGVVDVKVTNPGGSSATLRRGFTVVAPQSLLAGMTPSNFRVPAGWTPVVTQGFEGSLPGSQSIFGTITSNKPHTGGKSLQGLINSDGAGPHWFLNQDFGVLGSFSEVYLSFYNFLDSNGSMNDELNVANFKKHDAQGNLAQEVVASFLGAHFNALSDPIVIVPQSATVGITEANYGPTITAGWGLWTQWEIHYRPNSPGSANGFYRIYRNGTLIFEVVNHNFNASVDMTDATVLAGGVYTKLIWRNADRSCASDIGMGTDDSGRCTDFNNCVCPPNPPIFNRYIDDVILLKK